MSIYTKTGDQGRTGLLFGERIDKDHLRVETYGTMDELNANLGFAKQALKGREEFEWMEQVQWKLFDLGAELATPEGKAPPVKIKKVDIDRLENRIDIMQTRFEIPTTFILPGSDPISAPIHIARTVCRRGERRLIQLSRQTSIRSEALQYMNRLSDFLYALARAVESNPQKIVRNVKET